MYSTCLFCHASLGANDALEHFPVGRRVAYDPEHGRLWAVCPRCERWNLSPLETRWEALEEAERAFRATRLRVATDNIALARLRDGLELVRVGRPPRLELAAWRYGDQFGRRRRRHLAIVTTAVAASALQLVAPLAGLAALGTIASLTVTARSMSEIRRQRRDATLVRLIVPTGDGTELGVTYMNVRCATLVPTDGGPGWELALPYRRRFAPDGSPAAAAVPIEPRWADAAKWADGEMRLRDAAAQRALAMMMPHLNRAGAGARGVREAVAAIEAARDLDDLLRTASVDTTARRTHFKVPVRASNVGALPARLRLALEMVLHEDDERRALEGELHVLEARWRQAEEIARIADALLVPRDVEDRVAALRAGDPGDATHRIG